jgi:hypothetical protein
MRAAIAGRQVADVRQNIEPIELCLFDAGSDVNEPLLDTIKNLFFMAWELACARPHPSSRVRSAKAPVPPDEHSNCEPEP